MSTLYDVHSENDGKFKIQVSEGSNEFSVIFRHNENLPGEVVHFTPNDLTTQQLLSLGIEILKVASYWSGFQDGGRERVVEELELLPHMHSYRPNLFIGHHLIEIDEDRYGGAYSGAAYTAWHGFRPDDVDAGDGTCEAFWKHAGARARCGKGDTPQAAYLDLKSKTYEDFIESVEFVKLYQIGLDDRAWLHNSAEFQAFLGEPS